MNAPALASRRRIRPAFVPTLAAIAAVALFVAAGQWQHGRMEQKQALRTQYDAAAAAPPVALPDLRDWTSWRYRPIVVTGIYDAGRQILVDNKIHDGRTGYDVVTPLALADGRVVLVDRGWIAGGATRVELPKAPPPAGIVSVRGRVNVAAGYVELTHEAPAGPVWQNLDPQRFTQATGVAVLPLVVEQTAPAEPTDTLVRDWPAPDLGIERHRIYMFQWYTFAAMAAGLWLYFTLRRAR
ncbi:MAG: SURF1 family protein [Casimicrobiaceae bacterium]